MKAGDIEEGLRLLQGAIFLARRRQGPGTESRSLLGPDDAAEVAARSYLPLVAD